MTSSSANDGPPPWEAGAPADRGCRPAHHRPDGTFEKPWLPPRTDRHGPFPMLRWMWDRWTGDLPPTPSPSEVPRGTPRIADPRDTTGDLRATFVGHATWLLQFGGWNVLTDPHLTERASPLRWLGPKRFMPPGVELDDLPPIDLVVISHDHFDHLDDSTVRGLHARFGDAVTWVTPLGYHGWFAERGIRTQVEVDWWETATVEPPEGAESGGGSAPTSPLRATCFPVQHWCRRGRRPNERLWGGFRIEVDGGPAVCFAGDSGWWDGFHAVGERLGPHDLVLVPIGAYQPRWFMRLSHMNPEEAVRLWEALGSHGVCAGMHWGGFRLTDEDPLEPPLRMRSAWESAGHPPERLALPGVGGTVVVRGGRIVAR